MKKSIVLSDSTIANIYFDFKTTNFYDLLIKSYKSKEIEVSVIKMSGLCEKNALENINLKIVEEQNVIIPCKLTLTNSQITGDIKLISGQGKTF